MTKNVICDSGIISSYLLNNKIIVNKINNEILLINICITGLNRIELMNWLSGYSLLTKIERAKYLKFIKAIPLIHINEPISKIAIELSDKNINSKQIGRAHV